MMSMIADSIRHGYQGSPRWRHRRLTRFRLVGAIAALAALLFLPSPVPSSLAQDQVSITIVHTNDLHAMMLPFEENEGAAYQGEMVGGFSRISTLIQKVRSEEENVLLVDAGDTIVEDQHLMGNYFKGEPVIKLMNQMGYDLAVPGNHDFEFGLDVLAQRLRQADFTYLAANIVPAEEPTEAALELTSQMEPYVILSMAGAKVGVLGLTQPLHEFPGIEIQDTVQIAQAYVPRLVKEADIVIVVTHQELARDYEIVDSVDGIDVLLAAHEHDVVFDHGLLRNNALIAKTSSWGREVGRVDLTLEKGPDGFLIKEAQARLLPVTATVAEDEGINRILAPYLQETDQYQTYLIPGLIGAFLVIVAVLVVLMRRAASDF